MKLVFPYYNQKMSEMIDFNKIQKELYLPKTKPSIVDVPKMQYIMIDGSGIWAKITIIRGKTAVKPQISGLFFSILY
jgi:hypothetical protein